MTRKLLLVPALATAALAVGVPAANSAREIKVGDNYFVRSSGVPTVTVSKGTMVKWVWKGRSLHNVKVKQGPGEVRLVLDDARQLLEEGEARRAPTRSSARSTAARTRR